MLFASLELTSRRQHLAPTLQTFGAKEPQFEGVDGTSSHMVAHLRPANLRDILVRAKLPLIDRRQGASRGTRPGFKKCGNTRCLCYSLKSSTVEAFQTGHSGRHLVTTSGEKYHIHVRQGRQDRQDRSEIEMLKIVL